MPGERAFLGLGAALLLLLQQIAFVVLLVKQELVAPGLRHRETEPAGAEGLLVHAGHSAAAAAAAAVAVAVAVAAVAAVGAVVDAVAGADATDAGVAGRPTEHTAPAVPARPAPVAPGMREAVAVFASARCPATLRRWFGPMSPY